MAHATPHKLSRVSFSTSGFEFGLANSAPSSPATVHANMFEFDEPFPNSTPDTSSTESPPPLLRRLTRQNLLSVRTSSLNDLASKTQSPLRTSFSRRTAFLERSTPQEESDSDRERDKEEEKMRSSPRKRDSISSSSEMTTPPLPLEADGAGTGTRPTTPPRSIADLPVHKVSLNDRESRHSRRLSHSVKPPRLLSLMAESNPAENELQSEAQFQRLLASYNGMPIGRPKSNRAMSDRGRYPEEAVNDDYEEKREDTPSEDDDEISSMTAVGSYTSTVAPVPLPTPQASYDDMAMVEGFRNSPASSFTGMDVDMPPPPAASFVSASSSSSTATTTSSSPMTWRQTPPPIAPASRPNKRKHEDRYDPYPTASKRRAVSPSFSALRESLYHAMGSTGTAIPIPRSPVVRSHISTSVASSPGASTGAGPLGISLNLTGYGFGSLPLSRPMSVVSSPVSSSPQHRPVSLMASPNLRPALKNERGHGQKEIDGAGEAVGSLTLA